MPFDLRRCSKEDLDELNERGREWRAKNSPAPAAAAEPPVERPEVSRMEGTDQLAFDFLAEPL
jgi:hypothetical protein